MGFFAELSYRIANVSERYLEQKNRKLTETDEGVK